jgi:hypothetical protein
MWTLLICIVRTLNNEYILQLLELFYGIIFLVRLRCLWTDHVELLSGYNAVLRR